VDVLTASKSESETKQDKTDHNLEEVAEPMDTTDSVRSHNAID
jgi:hypothetical protein